MYKVKNANEFAGKVVSYGIINLETEEETEVRTEQLEDFCILRNFVNSKYENGQLVPTGSGFEIKKNLLPNMERKEKLMSFFYAICTQGLEAVSYCNRARVECDPTEFLVTCSGMTGAISAFPGTEYFNRVFPTIVDITGIKIAERNSINPVFGGSQRFWGWQEDGLSARNELGDVSFRISHRTSSRPVYLNYFNRWGDVFWVLSVYGDVNGELYISKDNKVLETVIFKSK